MGGGIAKLRDIPLLHQIINMKIKNKLINITKKREEGNQPAVGSLTSNKIIEIMLTLHSI